MPFRDLAGHRHVLDLTARAAARGSLPPSLIFAGPDGVGKRHATDLLAATDGTPELLRKLEARGFVAQTKRMPTNELKTQVPRIGPTLNDAQSAPDACGHCTVCRRVARGVHADVLMIEPGDSGSIKVDQVRGAIERSAYRPFEGRRRVVIVDEADAMEAPAQNALRPGAAKPA